MARYQRHYEWGRREMEHLLDDLGEAYEIHRTDAAADAYHFFGNVILFDNPAGYLEVVDGQQRLTSLTAFLAAARDTAGDAMLNHILAPLLVATDASGARQPRLHLHRGDDAFLRQHIVADSATNGLAELGKQDHNGAECLRINTLLARSWLANLPESDRATFVRFVLQQSRFVEIQVGTEDDAFRIFETVNSRGRPIASEDVLRYALVEFATDDLAKRDELLDRWDAMEAELGPRGMKRFISGWRTRVTRGSQIKQAVHRTLLNSFETRAEALTFLDNELSADLSIFKQIDTADIAIADGPVKQRIDTLLRSLALLDFDEWMPVASVLIARGGGQPERIAADLARIERLAWFYYLSRDDKGVHMDRREHSPV